MVNSIQLDTAEMNNEIQRFAFKVSMRLLKKKPSRSSIHSVTVGACPIL